MQHKNHRYGNTSYSPGNAFTWDDHSPPLLFQWCTTHIDMVISNLSTYTEDANAHIRFIPDIWIRCETNLRISELMFFYLIHVYGSFQTVPHETCHIKMGIGSLEPCNVSAAYYIPVSRYGMDELMHKTIILQVRVLFKSLTLSYW